MFKKRYFKLFSILLFLMMFSPVTIKGLSYDDLSEDDKKIIQGYFEEDCTTQNKTFTIWTVAYFRSDGNSSEKSNFFCVKREEGYSGYPTNLSQAQRFKISNQPSFGLSSIQQAFTKLTDVEKNNRVDCGELNENGYTNCKGNDYCNYFCSKMRLDMFQVDRNSYNAVDENSPLNVFGVGTPLPVFGYSNTSIQARSYVYYQNTLKNYTMNIKHVGTAEKKGNVYDCFQRSSSYTSPEVNSLTGGFNSSIMAGTSIRKFVEGREKNSTNGSKEYSVNEHNQGVVYFAPIKFSYDLQYTSCEPCTVDDNSIDFRPGDACEDFRYNVEDNPFVCKYKYDNANIEDKKFDIITDLSGNGPNPFCYKQCKNIIEGVDINTVQGEYKAGRGFDWDFTLNYERSCEINILLDKYRSSTLANKGLLLDKCYQADINEASDLSVYITDFYYGDKKYEPLKLDKNTSQEPESSSPYTLQNDEVSTSSTTKMANRNVEKIIITNENNGLKYTTDEFGCVLKSGLAVNCNDFVNQVSVPNETTYPIAFTQHPVKGVPITLSIYFDNGKNINKKCHYDVINEIFGKEDDPDVYDGYPKESEGIDIIYRPIQLSNPFPSVDGKVDWSSNSRNLYGSNWTEEDVKNVILNNRRVSADSVYNKEPLYTIKLGLSEIGQIRSYNGENSYNNFVFDCDDGTGLECVATNDNILKKLKQLDPDAYSGTCSDVKKNSKNYYLCADKNEPSTGGGNS